MDRVTGFKIIAGLAMLMVAIHLLNMLTGYSLTMFGLVPRTAHGLVGIVTSPFLHVSFAHLIANLVPFLVLGTLVIAEGFKRFAAVSAIIILLGGSLVWLFGFNGVHVGASAWVFGLWAYLLGRAWFHRSWSNVLIAGTVALLYGGLIFGFIPRQGVSVEGHIGGAFAGFIAARLLLSAPPASRAANSSKLPPPA
ncbi:rhomboid family intramembrane serine protease [Pseudomonas brassicacearum]|uniref:Rhomboid family intramembrane serine protease n=1 Tax=Pseudomonas brassicacearum TaxID=930166 RepID=A0A423HCR8_9PSED|nr:rhomboid family intramembrane serine protease [Pseudomonas brassicacearum]RON10976.1 rhomboid family intramembrane serine protease [Pseudomonas brassicacearum]